MAFTGDFSVTQNNQSTITLTDTSSGSDVTITGRTITLTKYDTNLLSYNGSTTIDWDLADDSITLTGVLDKDYALNITVSWNTGTPDPAGVYSVTKLMEFDFYDMIQMGQLIAERMARNPAIVNDTNFMANFFKYYSFIVSARISTGLMNDITKSQFALDLATYYRINQTFYY